MLTSLGYTVIVFRILNEIGHPSSTEMLLNLQLRRKTTTKVALSAPKVDECMTICVCVCVCVCVYSLYVWYVR